MTEIEKTPPMSGDNLPLKELKTEKKPETKEELAVFKAKKQKKRIYFIFTILLILFFIIGIWLGFYFKQKNDKPVSLPLPSPSVELSPIVSPSPSPLPEGIEGRIDAFKKKLEEVDLKEEDFSPPVLDFKIRFKIKD